MTLFHLCIVALGFASLIVAAGYIVLVVAAVLCWYARERPSASLSQPPVTVLKPLCGAEPGLYANLRSFCMQNYPHYEIVFGLAEADDPARFVVERLRVEFPDLPIKLVCDPSSRGSNRKVSNLINMLPQARFEILVMADSDAFVGPDYLAAVTAPLEDRAVGLVTCLYCGIPTAGIWSRIGAMYINEWYIPSVLLTWLFGYSGYVSGQTLCIRRSTLDALGGLELLRDQLAEDYRLGELVRERGLRVVLSHYLLHGEHHEPDLGSMTRHEVRWMRTLRALRPRSFAGMFATFSLPLALLGMILLSGDRSAAPLAWSLVGVIVAARFALHVVHRIHAKRPALADLWLLPMRDLLLCWVWCRSLFTSRVSWRGVEFDVDAHGAMRRVS